jgi:hypothetical protein
MITSTICMSLYPIDKRKISQHMASKFNERELREYVDEKNAFKALMNEHRYRAPMTRDKDKEYKDTYLCSFIHKSTF